MQLEQLLDAFFKDLRYILETSGEFRRRLDRELASAFSVFDYIEPDERKLSLIIADLLNPHGNHGQGTLFLMLLLNRLDRSLPTEWRSLLDHASVRREVRTNPQRSYRLIDILIVLKAPKGDFAIGIENKPFATESKDQLKDYHSDLDLRYDGKSVLIFLSKKMSPKSIELNQWTNLIDSGRAFNLNFRSDFFYWLSECRTHCECDKVRNFIRDFQNYIDQRFQN